MKTNPQLRRERQLGCIISIVLLATAVAAFVAFRIIVRRSIVPTVAMSPTVHANDQVLVNRFAYTLGGKPRVGDVARFRGKDGSLLFRVVGGPGDTLEMQDNVLFRNGERVDEPYVMLTPDIPAVRSFGPVTVPRGHYFFLGDNRDNANDSRFIGFISRDRITGRMFYVLHIGECADE